MKIIQNTKCEFGSAIEVALKAEEATDGIKNAAGWKKTASRTQTLSGHEDMQTQTDADLCVLRCPSTSAAVWSSTVTVINRYERVSREAEEKDKAVRKNRR